jgi:hypothetical protein
MLAGRRSLRFDVHFENQKHPHPCEHSIMHFTRLLATHMLLDCQGTHRQIPDRRLLLLTWVPGLSLRFATALLAPLTRAWRTPRDRLSSGTPACILLLTSSSVGSVTSSRWRTPAQTSAPPNGLRSILANSTWTNHCAYIYQHHLESIDGNLCWTTYHIPYTSRSSCTHAFIVPAAELHGAHRDAQPAQAVVSNKESLVAFHVTDGQR